MSADYKAVARQLEDLAAEGRTPAVACELRRLAENVRRMGVMVKMLRDMRSRDLDPPRLLRS